MNERVVNVEESGLYLHDSKDSGLYLLAEKDLDQRRMHAPAGQAVLRSDLSQ